MRNFFRLNFRFAHLPISLNVQLKFWFWRFSSSAIIGNFCSRVKHCRRFFSMFFFSTLQLFYGPFSTSDGMSVFGQGFDHKLKDVWQFICSERGRFSRNPMHLIERDDCTQVVSYSQLFNSSHLFQMFEKPLCGTRLLLVICESCRVLI